MSDPGWRSEPTDRPDPSPPEFSIPPYGTGSLADLMPSIAGCLGVPGYADLLGLGSALAEVRRVIVLLIDGLGEHNRAEHEDIAPALSALASPIAPIQAARPSTTPVNIASLCTGVAPGEHGIVGFTVAVPGTDRLLTHIDWGEDPDPRQWQPVPTVFERARRSGVAVHAVGPGEFIGSGLTEASHRGCTYRAAVSPGDLAAHALRAAAQGERSLVYAYHGALDLTGHVRGASSLAWRFQLAQADRIVASIMSELAGDSALVVTADHGMLDVEDADKIDLDAVDGEPGAEMARALSSGVRLVAGEPRARYVHAAPGAAADVLAAWAAVLGERAWVLSRDQAIAEGHYGPSVPLAHAERIGEVVAWARGGAAFTASRREPGAHRLVGYHGSLTAAELTVPVRVGRT